MTGELQRSEQAAVLTLGICRPDKRNAFSPELLQELAAGLDEAAARRDIRVIVLRGADKLPFSAGYDIGQLPARTLTTADARRLQAPIRMIANRLATIPKPVIGAARRFVHGAALDIFAHCDLRVACHGTAFSLPPTRLGFSYPAEGIARLVWLLGASRATELSLMAEPVDDEVMQQWGFLHRRWPDEAFEAELSRFAAEVATRAPLSLAALKSVLADMQAAPSSAQVEAAYQALAATLNSADAQEGLAALRAKRHPVFRGS